MKKSFPARVVVVMPAYNAAKTLLNTYLEIPENIADQVILVDDASRDGTLDIAKGINVTVFRHNKNYGYGGNQKTCYTEALRLDAEIVVMLHPDYQYDPKLIPFLIQPILMGNADIVLGSRFLTGDAIQRGMPIWKYCGNRLLTGIENFVLKQNLSEYHSGYRAFSRRFLESVPFNSFSNNFVFDQQILIEAVRRKYVIQEIQAPARYFKEASSIDFTRSIQYGLATLKSLAHYWVHMKIRAESPEPVLYVKYSTDKCVPRR